MAITAAMLLVPLSHALPINVTVDASGNLMNGVGVANADQYGLGNNNPTSNLAFLTDVVGNYNANYNPDFAAPTSPVAFDSGSLNVSSYSTIGGYDYVVFHFGAGGAAYAEIPAWIPDITVPAVYKNGKLKKEAYVIPGHYADAEWEKSSSGWWAAYYIGGVEGLTFSVPIPGPNDQELIYNGKPVGGFSSARYYNPHVVNVPEGGFPVSLFGAVLIAMALFARRLRR